MSTPTPVGGEFAANTTLPGGEKNRDIIALADGTFVVLWEDSNFDTASFRIFGGHFSSDGTPLGSEFPISPSPDTMSPFESYGAGASLADGGFVIFWEDESGLQGQRFNANASAVGDAFLVTNDQSVNSFNLGSIELHKLPGDAVGFPDGGYVVAWTASDGDGAGVYFQRYLADGPPAGGPVQANVTTDNDQAVPSIAVLADGTFTISWHSLSDTIANNGITVRHFSATGTPISDEIVVDDVGLYAKSIALEGGRYVVAWPAIDSYDIEDVTTDHTHICARIYNADGTPFGPVFGVSTTEGFCVSIPSLAALDDGGFVVVWTLRDGDDYNVLGQRFNADGTPNGSEFIVHSGVEGNQSEATITALPSSQFVVSWWDFTDESNNDTQARIFRYDSAGSSNLPDLIADAVQLSETTLTAGDSFTVTFDLHNIGDAQTASFTSGIYLSTDSIIDTSDTLLLSPKWPALDAGNTFHNIDTVTLPSELTSGTYYIGVYADRLFQIAETDEGNNVSNLVAVTIQPPSASGPDLVATNLTLGSTTWSDGDTITVNYNVENIGGTDAANSVSRVYISTDTNITAFDTLLLEDTSTGTMSPGEVNPEGEPNSFTLDFASLGLAPGTYYVGAVTDVNGDVSEDDEGNNVSNLVAVTIQAPSASGPDLVATNLTLGSTTWSDGDTITVNYDVENIGGTDAANSVSRVYISTDTNITAFDTLLLEDTSTGTMSPGEVNPEGEPNSFTLDFASLGLAPGTYYVGAVTDVNGDVSEDDEGNNVSNFVAVTLSAAPPDDYAGSTATTGNLSAGGSVTGAIEVGGDQDWFAIDLDGGLTYTFDLEGSPTGNGTLPDPYLRLLDATGNQITFDDDAGTGLNSQISYTATSTGTYYLSAQAYELNVGTYTLSTSAILGTPGNDTFFANSAKGTSNNWLRHDGVRVSFVRT